MRECTITSPLGHFSISSEKLIDFELTFFMVLACSTDNRGDEVRSPFRKAYNLIG